MSHNVAMSTDARVTARFTASSADELYDIGGWAHDAEFDWERITFDEARGVVTIRFAQEVLP